MSDRKGRILLADDNQAWLDELFETLQQEGYDVETASTIDEARQKLTSKLFHLLILDIRMQDDDQSNTEGINLLREIKKSPLGKAIRVIILSAHDTRGNMRAAFKEDAVDVINKGEFDNDEFIQKLPEIFEKHIKINLSLDITWQQGTDAAKIVQGLEIGEERIRNKSLLQASIALELDDLLCRLFRDAKRVVVRPLTPGNSGTGVLSVRPVYETGAARAMVVKFGEAGKVDDEYFKYKKYAEPYIGGGRNTTTIAVANTPRLGGITYSLLGATNDKLESFGEFYYHTDEEQIKNMLHRLFKETCGAWYANPGKQDTLKLSTAYPQHLNFTWEKLHTTLADSLRSVQGKDKLTFNALNSSRKFTNPIRATENQDLVYLTYTCITHGDFNQNNILVDNDGHSWLIDFQGTEPGHILRDIVALDTEIRCKFLRADEATLTELLKMEEALCSIAHFSEVKQLTTRFQTFNPALTKIYTLVAFLRELANNLTPNHDDSMDEYYTALLYYALNASRFRTSSTLQREHALLSASLLADKLGL